MLSSGSVGRPLRQQFGKYQLLARIASGGMGEVLLARLSAQAGFQKLVVIKRILPHLTDRADFVRMFLHEAQIAARLNHPNICQVYELGQIDKQYYMSMEYLEGVPFVEVLLARNRAPQLADPRLTCALIVQACEGLHYAHDLREPDGTETHVVHRDVNPKNIFVTSAGSAKILDFGVVKTRAGIDLTRSGAVKGTYAYMSPEQIRGAPIDRRSDVFSLGVVTFEAITGSRLFKRPSDLRTFKAITEEPIPRASDLVPGIPPELDDAISTALARDRDARYASARDYAIALERGLHAYGAPFSSIAIAAEIERSFGAELERKRQVVMQALPTDDPEFDVPTELFDENNERRVELEIRLPPGAPRPAEPNHAAAPEPPPAIVVAPALAPPASGPVITPGPARELSGRAIVPPDFSTPPITMVATGVVEAPAPPRRWVGIAIGILVTAIGVAIGLWIVDRGGIGAVAADDDTDKAPSAAVATEPAAQPDATAPSPDARPAVAAATATADAAVAAIDAAPPADAAGPGAESDGAAAGGVQGGSPETIAPPPSRPERAERREAPSERREPPRERAEPPRRGHGTLTVNSRPYSIVYVDGKRRGETPIVKLKLAAGPHTLRLVPSSGARDKRFRIVIQPDKELRKQVKW